MSGNRDVHLIRGSCFMMNRGLAVLRPGAKWGCGRMGLFYICIAGLILLFCASCTQKQQAVELYVDAVMLNELDEREKAVEKLNSAVKVNNRFSLAYSLLGEIYQEMENYERSAAAYEKAAGLNPWSFKDCFNLGRVYQITKKFVQAVKAYVRACELKPNHFDAHINTARCYYEIRDYDSALIYGERAERLDPDVSKVQKLLGDIYESQKDHDQAISSYKRALEIESNNPEIKLSLAVCYLRTDRNEPAKELLTSVIQIQPDNNDAYKYLGYCYLKFYNQAVVSYKSASNTDSYNTELLASLKDKASEMVDKSVESYSRAIEINDKDWDAHRGLGVAYILKGKSEDGSVDKTLKAKAVEHWRLSLDIKPDQPNHRGLLKLIRTYSK